MLEQFRLKTLKHRLSQRIGPGVASKTQSLLGGDRAGEPMQRKRTPFGTHVDAIDVTEVNLIRRTVDGLAQEFEDLFGGLVAG